MKINKIFIFSLIMLTTMSLAVVSAVEDNSTIIDNQTLQSVDDETISDDLDNEILNEDDEGTYIDPSEAYQYLNEFRTSKGVWFWDADNENIIYYNTHEENQLKPLEIDKGLEEVAKIRAKEIVINFEHERPDGSMLMPLYENYTGYNYFGENIAFSYFTGWDVTEAWKESSLPHSGQGHRRGMLNPIINCVGIAGYIEPGGCPFWVQAFGYNGIPSQQPNPNITYDDSKSSFDDLYHQILTGNSVKLDRDYEFKNESFHANGITIDKAVTIDGCGHTIDAKKLARIFNITVQGVILKNINFVNAYVDYANGGAICTNGDLTLINCSFSDCFAYYGSAVYSTASALSLDSCSFNDNFEVRGVVFKDTGSVSFENSNFTNNSAILYGGALCINDANVTVINSIFKNNSAYLRGGAIFLARSNLSSTNSQFISNALDVGGPAYGGVLCGEDSDVILKDCIFSKNWMNSHSRQGFGGAVYLFDGTVSVIGCNFTDNFAMDYGGAICLLDNNANISGCSFIRNSVNRGSYISSAGAIYATGGNVSISQSLFSNNAAENGASIALDETEVSINKCDFLNNSAGFNGASVYSNNVNLTIIDCDFFNNTCKYNGGAIYLNNGRIRVMNSVFSKSVATYGAFICLQNAQILIVNDNFTQGTTKNQYYSYGGAMYMNNCRGCVEQSEFSANAVYSDEFTTMGGAIRCENSDVSFKDCDFSDNLADNGAAISSQNANITVSNSNFKNNTAKNNGGALEGDMCNISISNSEFKNGHSFRGGAVYSYGGSLNVAESVFTNNSAFWGGAINSAYCNATAYDSNFTGNVADWAGGALYTCNAVNSIFIKNKANTASAIYGENNNATGCTFIENVAYDENPAYGVATKDCTFKDNKQIIKVIFDVSLVQDIYYGGDLLPVYICDEYGYKLITDATVTIRVYDGKGLVKSADFSSEDYGWRVNLTEGIYYSVLSIDEDGFEAEPVNISFTVLKKPIATLDVSVANVSYLNPITVELKSNVDAGCEIYIDAAYTDYCELAGNVGVHMDYYNIPAGQHDISIIMTPTNPIINKITENREFTVYRKDTSVSLEVKDVTDAEDVIVSVQASESGNVVVRIGDVSQSIFVNANEKTEISFGVMKSGTYDVTAQLTVNENYIDSNDSKELKISAKITQDDIKISIPKGDSKGIAIILPKDATGTVTLSIAGETYTVDLIDGSAEVILPDLNGEHNYVITYPGDEKYTGFDISGSVNTYSSGENVLIRPEIEVSELDNGGTVKLPDDAQGTVTLSIDGTDYVFDVAGGIAYVTLPDLANGVYEYSITYSGDGKYSSFAKTGQIAVERPIVISTKNLNALYTAGQNYQIIVKNDLGIPADGARVVIKLNGKAFKTLTTDSNGVVKFKVTQVPGTYKVKISALGASTTKTLTVKHVVKLKSVTVKKSAKKLVLTATLTKVNGKYLKSKKVTFKFNGKKYVAKTNKKGVAKVTIKSSILKKLKVGKKVTYQATYLKDIVKKTAKIKK